MRASAMVASRASGGFRNTGVKVLFFYLYSARTSLQVYAGEQREAERKSRHRQLALSMVCVTMHAERDAAAAAPATCKGLHLNVGTFQVFSTLNVGSKKSINNDVIINVRL
jgi:hypothetical protein